MNLSPKTSIGVEIEVNNYNRRLETSMATDVWSTVPEHCGTELRSIPCKTPGAIRRLITTLDRMHVAAGETPGFDNTGTHIHIDFLQDIDENVVSKQLRRITSERDAEGKYFNPVGTDKKYYWIGTDGSLWAKPRDFASFVGANKLTPSSAARAVRESRYLISVKRFLTLGIRFANSLFGLQHPDRRFNKYCHTLAYWNEDLLNQVKSIQEICAHPNLLQGHRRHMLNVMAFPKYGTVEVRMIRGSLSPDEIWPQIFLFGKMARLAKSADPLPQTSGNIFVDFGILLDACEVHGKMRRTLTEMFLKNASVKGFKVRCYRCERFNHFGKYTDYGLSRGVCDDCTNVFALCAKCGVEDDRESLEPCKLDEAVGGRYLCRYCYQNCNIDKLLGQEKSQEVLYLLGEPVGSGFDVNGPYGLRRMGAIFS